MNNPLVSVILPVFNAESYVTEAIESVLSQDYRPIEIICVNDGSTDASLDALRAFGEKIQVINCPKNQGIAMARNEAIRSASGEYVAFMDADDLWAPGKLSRQMRRLEGEPAADVSFTHIQCFLSPELPLEVRSLRHCPPDPLPGYIPGTAVMKMSVFKKVGFFSPEWRVGEFVDWMARARDCGMRFDLLPEVLFRRRIHASNTGVTGRSNRVDYVKIVKEALDRKRAAQTDNDSPASIS